MRWISATAFAAFAAYAVDHLFLDGRATDALVQMVRDIAIAFGLIAS